MKPIIPFALLGALFAVGAATAATTTPVGYTTQTLSQGFNMVGLTLQTPALASGNFETISGTSLTDTSTTYTVTAGRLYVLEITSGTLVGTIQEVPAANISGSTITTPQDLQALGLQTTDTYKLRVAPTLEEIFTTTTVTSGGVLQNGISSTGADIVWVPTGTGAYTKYFLHTTNAFRLAGTTTPTPNVPLVYSDGILVQKKGATAASLTVTGEVKTVGTNSVLVQGFNLISAVAPVGLTLTGATTGAGIEDDLQAGISATGADILWLQQPNLTYNKYFRHTTNNWRITTNPTVNLTAAETDAITIPSAFYIQKKGATANTLDLNVPVFYGSL